MRILVIEDDPLIGNGLELGLQTLGFSVDWFTDGKSGFNALESAPYDAVVLDLTLPKMDGLDVLKKWRKANKDIPVLVLSARDTLDERVEGLHLGADDYLCKPFALTEVHARLLALIRRRQGNVSPIIKHGSISFEASSHKLSINDKDANLTTREYRLAELFLTNKNRVLSRSFIEEKIHSWNDEISSNSLEVHVHNLRKKLGNKFIRTVHGIGYTLGKEDDIT